MEGNTYALEQLSYGLAGLVYAATAIHLGRKVPTPGPGGSTALFFFGAVSFTALWGWASLAGTLVDSTALTAVGRLADVLRYGCWYAFVLALLRAPTTSAGSSRRIGKLETLGALLVVAAAAAQLYAAEVVPALKIAPRIPAFALMALSVFGMFLIEQLFRNVQDDSRWNAKPVCLGLAGTFLYDFYLYSTAALFNSADSDAARVQGIVHALMAPLLVLSTTRRADWISKLRVSRKVAFHSASLLAAGVYLLFISSIGYYIRFFGGDWGRALQLALVFLALVGLVVIAVSGTVRAKVRVLLGKHFFRYRYDYREEWLSFTRTLSLPESPQEMGIQVIRGLADMVESPAGMLWTRDSRGDTVQTATWNMPVCDARYGIDSPLLRFMSQTGWVIDLDEYRGAPQRYEALILPGWLVQLAQAWLLVPLRVGDTSIGFVLLAKARIRVDVNWEVTDLLKTAGRQAASFLAQMQATEALLEARKFDAFNRMSAFVVHDLKNIVTQLSLMLKNAERLKHNAEFQQDMLMTVQNSLDRMRQLMLQLRDGASATGSAIGVDVEALARRMQNLVVQRGWTLMLELKERPMARGHEERLERVLGHLVQNAMDACAPADRIWMVVDRYGGSARIEVGDSGQGMPPEFVRDRLFKPFQSTKKGGMGIGAYESFQYVHELGGSISVESAPGKGTVVTLLLPLFDTRIGSDLHMLEPS